MIVKTPRHLINEEHVWWRGLCADFQIELRRAGVEFKGYQSDAVENGECFQPVEIFR